VGGGSARRPRSDSLARLHPWAGPGLNLLLALSLGLLVLGMFAPLLTLEKFFVFSSRVSLYSGLWDLASAGQWPLFAVILGFSVLLPLAKLGLLFRVWNLEPADSARHHRHVRWIAYYGKWSMLDVFVVATLVASVKLGSIAQVRVEYGIYAFAASVLLAMAANHWLLWVTARSGR